MYFMVVMGIDDSYEACEACVQVLSLDSNHKKKEKGLHSSVTKTFAMATARVVLSPTNVDMLSSQANLTPHLMDGCIQGTVPTMLIP